MSKNKLILFLLLAAGLAAAGEMPKTSSAVIHFVGRVVDTQCAIDLGGNRLTVPLESERQMIPVDITFHRCDEEARPQVRILPDRATKKDNAFRTNRDNAILELYKDGEASRAVCIDEDLLCGARHRVENDKDHTYRAMWVKVDRDRKAENIRSTINMEIQFD